MYQNHAFSFEIRRVVGLGTPLHEVARAGRPETAIVLLNHGANQNIPDSDGRTALEVAQQLNNHAVVRTFEQFCLRTRKS